MSFNDFLIILFRYAEENGWDYMIYAGGDNMGNNIDPWYDWTADFKYSDGRSFRSRIAYMWERLRRGISLEDIFEEELAADKDIYK